MYIKVIYIYIYMCEYIRRIYLDKRFCSWVAVHMHVLMSTRYLGIGWKKQGCVSVFVCVCLCMCVRVTE